MTRNQLTLAVLSLTAMLAGLAWLWASGGFRDHPGGLAPLELAPKPEGGDFTLQGVKGPVRLADLRGRVVLIYFGYTTCPDICPTNLAFIAAALRELSPEELGRVQVLFISVDPERDDLPRLADYAAYFHPNVLGITGTPQQVSEVAALYGAAYHRAEQENSALEYLVDHSAFTYLVDASGRLVRTLDHATPAAEIRAAIEELLQSDPTGTPNPNPGGDR